MSTLWTPMLLFVNVVFLTVYIKVGYLAYKAKREIRSQQVNSVGGQGNQNTSSSKSTRSLLLVILVFLSTYTIWLIVYYFAVDKYTETVELIQTLIEWFWQVSTIYKRNSLFITNKNSLFLMKRNTKIGLFHL